MRIMLLTGDRETAKRYRNAAQTAETVQLCVTANAAQTLERLFREPFDAMLTDDPGILHPRLRKSPVYWPDPICLLLRRPLAGMSIPAELTFCFPCDSDPKEVLARIGSFPSTRRRRITPEVRISRFLQNVGVPVSLSGFDCMREAIRMLLSADLWAGSVTVSDLYEALAFEMQASASVMEHSIRHAIDAAWIRADMRTLERVFGYTIDAERAAPSNAAFLFRAADHIGLCQREEIGDDFGRNASYGG